MRTRILVAVLAIATAAAFPVGAQCLAGWSTAFASPGDGWTSALAVFDEGSGPRLFANGEAGPMGRWDGFSWSAVQPFPAVPPSTGATAFATFDDGSGPAVYVGFSGAASVGGPTPSYIGKWNGAGWAPVGGGIDGPVNVLTVFDDGFGPALYAGGNFVSVSGGVPAHGVARWNGTAWAEVGGGISGSLAQVHALAGLVDANGPALYVGGLFTQAGGVAAANVARWNGASWSALGAGVGPGTYDSVRAIAAFDSGAGPEVYVTGIFTAAGGSPANNIAKWNGAAWSGLGSGLALFGGGTEGSALFAWNDGTGLALYVGGYFDTAGGILASNVARYSGTSWSGTGGLTAAGQHGWVRTFLVFDDGTGPALHAGGAIDYSGNTATGAPASGVARWNGAAWSALPAGGLALPNFLGVMAFDIADLGSGPALYAGGAFYGAGDAATKHIACWKAGRWSGLGAGITSGGGFVDAVAAFDDGSGPAVYAGGAFTQAGGINASSIARWNGTSWSALSAGLTTGFTGPYARARALAVFDDGSGPALYAGGQFTAAGGAPASNVARWNGTAWSAIGGLPGAVVHVFLVGDLGAGPELFIGGELSGTSFGFVGRLSGSSWQTLGVTQGTMSGVVKALAVFDDGSGPALYAGGSFDLSVDGVPAAVVAKLAGFWSAVGTQTVGSADDLAIYDDGTGAALYAIGKPFIGGGSPMNLGRWSGGNWTAVGGDLGNNPTGFALIDWGPALKVYDDGAGPALYAGGGFLTAGGLSSVGVARWGPLRPSLELTQPGPGGAVTVRNGWLQKSHEYYNVFSDSPCGGAPGSGPLVGLCAPNPAFLISQVTLPVGAVPFHFIAPVARPAFGPYAGVPPGVTVDMLCFDWTGGALGCASVVHRLTFQ